MLTLDIGLLVDKQYGELVFLQEKTQWRLLNNWRNGRSNTKKISGTGVRGQIETLSQNSNNIFVALVILLELIC